MKNILLVNIDTERTEQPIIIGKPEDIKKPETAEEAKDMILNDIATLCEGLCTLINMAGNNGYETKDKLVQASVLNLNKVLESKTPTE